MQVKQCKVCMSKHKEIIEELAVKKLSPEKIYEYLKSMTNPNDIKIVEEENIKPSSIRRHLQRHFNELESLLVQEATTKSKIKKSREKYKTGVKINIDKANTIAHMIEIAIARMEEVESLSDSKKHQYTIGYLGQVKALVDELNKVSSVIKEESTIDANFYRVQVDNFAKIVLSTIRALDVQFNLNFQLETAFSEEFKKQMQLFKAREDLIFSNQLNPHDDDLENNINTFNDASKFV